jgi:predicted ATPase/class 3 adenylate cyclase
MADLPSGTVTFLFTDIEGSTRLWERHPKAMKDAMARHDEILREAVVAHHGYVVKTTGDGFHAAFASARDAIDAAVDAQLLFAAELWGAAGPLQVRMGIHTGLAEVRAGDYYGTAVNKAARLMSVAHGGQIVVSLATEELVQDGDVELIDLGEHALRDLARRERVFQVAASGLRREFPRLSTSQAIAGNLPLQVSSFVGRDDDVARLVEMLGYASLVTLTGSGGVGKTRLAVQAAAEAVPRFPDGAWFCELAAVDSGDALAQVVAASVGCVQRPGLSLAESIVEYLRVRALLLVLDNCEHLLDAAGTFADAVVRSCPNVSVIATSREALDVDGERVVRVGSLFAPASSAGRDELVESAAVQLFTDRAADVGADTAWDDQQWAAVGEICRRVDGIPLAIELAAARTTSMSPLDVATHLDARFRLLTGKRRGRVERHQTLRATVDWSYQLLNGDERAVFDRLGVFSGSFDAQAAVAVVSGENLDGWTVTEALSSLVAKSMVGSETGPDGASRYAVNETLRQYARDRLDESGDMDRRRRAHAHYYASWAQDAGYGLTGPDDVLWMARIRAEVDNMRATVGWTLDRHDADDQELGLRILACLVEARAARELSLGSLAVRAVLAAEASGAELRVPVLTVAANDEWDRGHVERARNLAHAAMRDGIATATANPIAPYQVALGIEMTAGNHERAREIAEEIHAVLDTIDSPFARSYVLGTLAMFEAQARQIEEARAYAARAVEIAQQLGNQHLLAHAHHATAWALLRDDPAAALVAAEQCLDLYRNSDVPALASGSAAAMALASRLRARLGDDTGALELCHEAVIVGRDQGSRPQLAAVLDRALNPLARTGRPDIAAILIGALSSGALAEVSKFLGVDAARARTLDGVRRTLGDERTDDLLVRGTAMGYDELVDYAVQHLADRTDTNQR